MNGPFGYEAFGGVVVRENLAVPVVDYVGGVRHVGAREVIEGFTFGVNPSQFTVEAFVGAALPGVIGLGEVHLATALLGDVGMIGEFTAVVEDDGMHPLSDVTDGLDDGGCGRRLGVRNDVRSMAIFQPEIDERVNEIGWNLARYPRRT